MNGLTPCTLLDITPSDPRDLQDFLDKGDWIPGEEILISPPICITIQCDKATPPFNDTITFMTNDHHSFRRSNTIKVGRLNHDQLRQEVTVISSGYVPAYSGTTYAFQGQTLPKVIADFNLHRYSTLTIFHCNVTISRIEESLDFRVMPWTDENNLSHLQYLRYSDDYLQWYHAYDIHGNFQQNLIKPINQQNNENKNKSNKPKRPTSIKF